MSGVCLDCPGSHGCCYTYHGPDDDDDLDEDRTWEEWWMEVGFNIIMWTLVGGLAIGVAGLSFAAGMWGFVTGFSLLR
jgi:hypothetical protein